MADDQVEAGARALAAYERDEVAFQPARFDRKDREGKSEDYYRQRAAVVLLAAAPVELSPTKETNEQGGS